MRLGISIHALLAESDQCRSRKTGRPLLFLSTLSLRRATVPFRGHDFWPRYFYPRSPCGERLPHLYIACRAMRHFYPRSPCGERLLVIGKYAQYAVTISIHALLAESDLSKEVNNGRFRQFLSTLSLRRATVNGGDLLSCFANFYPRSPCGERPVGR